jgi:hypothetical protein
LTLGSDLFAAAAGPACPNRPRALSTRRRHVADVSGETVININGLSASAHARRAAFKKRNLWFRRKIQVFDFKGEGMVLRERGGLANRAQTA